MITGTFTCESGTVTVSIDTGVGTHTAHLTSVGSIKYTFDITPDSVVIDRLMAIYSKMDCSWGLYATDGQDLYDLLSVISGKADVTVTVDTWAGDSFVFPFSLEAKDVSLDERTQIIKTSFGVYADDTVTVGDVWDEIATNHASSIFTFRVSHTIHGTRNYDAVSVPKWYEVAMGLVFGTATTIFESYDVQANPPFQEPPDLLVYSPVPIDASNDDKVVYVCMDVDGLTYDTGTDAESYLAIQVMQSLAGHEGGVFGTGFSTNFYVNRASTSLTTVSVPFDDVLELGFDKNYKAFRFVRTGVIEKTLDSTHDETPNLLTQSIDSAELNPNAEKVVNLQLNAGFPILNAGEIDFADNLVSGNDPTANSLMVGYGLEAAQFSYLKALPADGALKISATLYGWGKVKPWELLSFDSTCPTRYQSKTFRINDVTYDFIKAQTKITAYEVT